MTPKLQKDIEDFINRKPPPEGWCEVPKALAMAELILTTKPKTVVEIGVFGGRSLVPQAMALRENGKGKIYGIDPWSWVANVDAETDQERMKWWATVPLEEIHRKCMGEIAAYALEDYVTIIRDCSHKCKELFGEIDILHIDGNHSETTSTRDVENYVPKVNANGWVWMDDTDWASTQHALSVLKQSCILIQDNVKWQLYCKRRDRQGIS